MTTARNHWRGEVTFSLAGADHVIQYDYAALARLRDEVGPDFDVRLDKAPAEMNVELVARVLAIGFARHHPDVTFEKVFAESPPLLMAYHAIRTAMRYTFSGEGEPPAEGAANPPKRAGWLARLIRSRKPSRPASASA